MPGCEITVGIRIPPPLIVIPPGAGDPCAFCWGPGKTFGDGDTPDQITVDVSGINKGPNWVPGDGEPPNSLYVLDQAGFGLPCAYQWFEPGLSVAIEFAAAVTTAVIMVNGAVFALAGTSNEACDIWIASNVDDHFTSGSLLMFVEET